MLLSRYRKTNLVEGILLWSSVVHADAKQVGDLLSDQGLLNGGQLCYTSAFTLLFYYIATRHRPVLVEALKGDTSTVQGETGVPEASARDEDGLPLVVGSCLTYLSLLLQSPTGEASSHCDVLLRSLVVLCEEADFVTALSRGGKATQRIFSTDKDVDPSKGYKEVNNVTAVALMSQIVLKFMSENMKLALDAKLYDSCLRILHRLLCYVKNYGGSSSIHDVLDVKLLIQVCLRLLTYVSRDAVQDAIGPQTANSLLIQAAQLISFLVVFGLTLLPGEESYPHLCYEVARVGANKVFNKLLTSCTKDGMECQLQVELRLLLEVSDHINSIVEEWIAQRPKQVSFTDSQILQVVSNAHLSLSLPLRHDLITFENLIEGEEDLSLVKERLALFVHRYARHIQILPSVFAGSEEVDRS
uniref:Armadillo-like helical domain-containing protein n=1 Tax=Hanusia phi TaxID=3032 RepID=A0A7S0F3U8_9CRYP